MTDLRCPRSGQQMHPPVAYRTKEGAQMSGFGRWICPDCNRTVKTTIQGSRGYWYRAYVEHPREGVTNKQWAARCPRRPAACTMRGGDDGERDEADAAGRRTSDAR